MPPDHKQEPTEPAQCAGPDPNPRQAAFALPAGATDSHAHVFGPREKYCYAASRLYNPPPVFLRDYLHMLDAAGFTCAVVVQSGVHASQSTDRKSGRLRVRIIRAGGKVSANMRAIDH